MPTHEDKSAKEHPVLWVRPDSNVQNIAGILVSSIGKDARVTLRAIGAGAVNQSVKSIIHARQIFAAQGEDLIFRPGFTTVPGNDGSEVTAIVFHCLLN